MGCSGCGREGARQVRRPGASLPHLRRRRCAESQRQLAPVAHDRPNCSRATFFPIRFPTPYISALRRSGSAPVFVLKTISGRELLIASAALIAALGDVAIGAGIESIVGNFDSTMLRLYRRIGCEVEVLGSTQRYGRPVYLGLFPISEPILRKVKGRLKATRTETAEPPDRDMLVS